MTTFRSKWLKVIVIVVSVTLTYLGLALWDIYHYLHGG